VSELAANPLVAARQDSTRWYTGLGLVESVASTVDGIESGSWIDASIGGVAASMDALATVLDPLGALASWGVAWLMEHVKPLSDALDWLAGDPDQIAAYAQTWRNVAVHCREAAADLEASVTGQVGGWSGAAAQAYRAHASVHLDALTVIARAAGGIGALVEGAGLLVALVRELVRDLIADFVSVLAVRLPMWLAETGFTLGAATPLVVSQVGSLVAKWAARIGRLVTALIESLRRLTPLLGRLGGLVDELSEVLHRLARRDPTAAPPPSGADPQPPAPAGPRDQRIPTGAGWVEDADSPYAAEVYRHAAGNTDAPARIESNTGIQSEVIERVRQHLFRTEHEVQLGPGQTARGHFTPLDEIADLWTAADNGTLDAGGLSRFRRLMAHEYVESRLMEAGLPYRSADPGAYRDGYYWPTAEHHGAHDLAPVAGAAGGAFDHWPRRLGMAPPDVVIADDLSNLEEVVNITLRGVAG